MGISEFMTVLLIGAGGTELVREAWRRMRAAADEVKPIVAAKPPVVAPDYADMTVDDLLDCTLEPNLRLMNIERQVLKLTGARPDSDEADLIMEAVYDGRNWDKVRELCEGHLWMKPGINRVARWV